MDTTGDDNTNQEERKSNYTNSDDMTPQQVIARLGIRLEDIAPGMIEPSELLASLGCRLEEHGLGATTEREHLREYDMVIVDDDNTNREERKSNYTSYAEMTRQQVDSRLGVRVESIAPGTIEASELLESLGYGLGGDANTMETKEKVFNHITEYLGVAGYPTGAIPGFNEAHINHLVYATIIPVLREFIRRTGRKNMRLRFEKEIVATDDTTGCTNEFAVMDMFSFTKEKFVLMVNVRGSSLGGAMSQCLPSLKDMRDNNGGGEVYGFVTTGIEWQMIRYDGEFQITEGMQVLFPRMDKNKELWMKQHSILVDCINVALDKGGFAGGGRR